MVAIGRIQNSRRDAGREISRHEHQENILVMIQKLHRSLKYERAQRELLERRIRSYENGWHIHDQALCDIREQLQEIRHLPADLNEALCSIAAGYRSEYTGNSRLRREACPCCMRGRLLLRID